MSVINLHAGTDSGNETLTAVKKLAVEAIRDDPNFLGKTRFSVDATNKVVRRDVFQFPPGTVLATNDPLNLPMDAYIRTLCLRRDFGKLTTPGDFWKQPLDEAEKAAESAMSNMLSATTPTGKSKIASQFGVEQEQLFKGIDKAIQYYAEQNGFSLLETRGSISMYRVIISVRPPARVTYMKRLEYLTLGLQTNCPGCVEDRWTDVTDTALLIGGCEFRISWPAELGGPAYRNYFIDEDMNFRFEPNSH